MDIECLKIPFKKWADSKDIIIAAWLYGSVLNGQFNESSDIDIAIQTYDFTSKVIINVDVWEKELQDIFQCEHPVHIVFYQTQVDQPKVWIGLNKRAVEIFRKKMPSGIDIDIFSDL